MVIVAPSAHHRLFLACGLLVLACKVERPSTPPVFAVELDIFSGVPNPRWVLARTEADSLTRLLVEVPRTSPKVLSDNLGYRGLIVQVTQPADTHVIRIQAGTIQFSRRGAATGYSHDTARALERWLLNTGRPHLKPELFQAVERELE